MLKIYVGEFLDFRCCLCPSESPVTITTAFQMNKLISTLQNYSTGIVPWRSMDYPNALNLAGMVPREYSSSHWSTRILTKSWRTCFLFTENIPNSLLFRGLRIKSRRIVWMQGDAFNFVPLNFQDPQWELKMHPWLGFGCFQIVISCLWLLASKEN